MLRLVLVLALILILIRVLIRTFGGVRFLVLLLVRIGLWTVGWGVAPTEFDFNLDLVAVHLDLEFPFESVGDDERNGVTARVQFHFGSRRQARPSAINRSDACLRESSAFCLISSFGTATPDLGEVCIHGICREVGRSRERGVVTISRFVVLASYVRATDRGEEYLRAGLDLRCRRPADDVGPGALPVPVRGAMVLFVL
ncbi:hypothetical protein NJ76_03200 [Rhodococcus sp. IITR03]|nr:hypothetical protein NJ76_03200 [Rhodococcus sp. IITR03]